MEWNNEENENFNNSQQQQNQNQNKFPEENPQPNYKGKGKGQGKRSYKPHFPPKGNNFTFLVIFFLIWRLLIG